MPKTLKNRNPHVSESSEYNHGRREARKMFREVDRESPTAGDLAYLRRQIRVSEKLAIDRSVAPLNRAFHRGFALEGLQLYDELEAQAARLDAYDEEENYYLSF